jgi:hypothetical protein
MIKKLFVLSFLLTAASVFEGFTQSQLELVSPDSTLRWRPHGYGHFRAGQVVNGIGVVSTEPRVSGIYTEEAYGGISMEIAYKEHLTMHMGVDVKMFFSYPQEINFFVTKYAREDAFLGPTYANFSYEKTRYGDFNLSIGYFDFKYNPDVKNLGEYMFRSATYPAYIITYMDYPVAKLLGTHLRHELLSNRLKQDVLFTTETTFYPTQDWSLSYLLSYNFRNILEVGAGANFSHLLSVYNDEFDPGLGSLTDPKKDGPTGNQYIDENGDTLYYTFRGNKAMARLSFDPKRLWAGSGNLFGKEDLKCYAEAIVIGTTSYPDTRLGGGLMYSYKNWQEKMPVIFGINLPAYRILDVFNMELEWWNSKYMNNYYNVYITTSLPIPDKPLDGINRSPWKWSVLAKKSFNGGHFSVIAQAARDHMRLPSANYQHSPTQEMLVEAGDWWWCLKTSFSF